VNTVGERKLKLLQIKINLLTLPPKQKNAGLLKRKLRHGNQKHVVGVSKCYT